MSCYSYTPEGERVAELEAREIVDKILSYYNYYKNKNEEFYTYCFNCKELISIPNLIKDKIKNILKNEYKIKSRIDEIYSTSIFIDIDVYINKDDNIKFNNFYEEILQFMETKMDIELNRYQKVLLKMFLEEKNLNERKY